MQEIFQVGPLLGDAAAASTLDLSDLFLPGTIPATVPVAGDFDHNGVADMADYVLWRNGLGTTYVQSDYDVWRTHFGQTVGGARATLSAAVPEPMTTMLLLISAAGLCLRRRWAPRRY
jgi:hypothetical protein